MSPNVLIELNYVNPEYEDDKYISMICKQAFLYEVFSTVDVILKNYDECMGNENDPIGIKALKLLMAAGGYISGEDKIVNLVLTPNDTSFYDAYKEHYDYKIATANHIIGASPSSQRVNLMDADYKVSIDIMDKYIKYSVYDSYDRDQYESKFADMIGIDVPKFDDLNEINVDLSHIPFDKWVLAKSVFIDNTYSRSNGHVIATPHYTTRYLGLNK